MTVIYMYRKMSCGREERLCAVAESQNVSILLVVLLPLSCQLCFGSLVYVKINARFFDRTLSAVATVRNRTCRPKNSTHTGTSPPLVQNIKWQKRWNFGLGLDR